MSVTTEWSAQIEQLLAESPAAAAERERLALPGLLRATDGSVVLFGAGKLGRLCARSLSRLGVPLRAFCDRNPALQGSTVEGVEVLAPAEAARRFGEHSLFAIAIWTGTARESMVERSAWLHGLGCRHVTTYAPLVWAGGREETPFHAFDLPSRVLAHAADLRRLAARLGDQESQRVLATALHQRLHGRFDASPPVPEQYFPRDVVELTDTETMIDGGAFDGDTLEIFLQRTGARFGAYHAFEPDPANAERLRARVARLPAEVRSRVTVHPLALHTHDAELEFASDGKPTSQVVAGGAVRVRGRALDDMLSAGEKVTFFKLDVEGAERVALQGAQGALERSRPVMAICVYHHPADLWEIPLRLAELFPESELFLRAHGFDGWEMVCYAIPPERRRQPRACPVCESRGEREILHQQRFIAGPLGQGYTVVVCGNCGAGFADDIPTQETFDRYYAERTKYAYDHAGGAESPYDFKRFEAIADQVVAHLPRRDARILDIGCATGGLLAVLKRRGYTNLLGSDPAPACRQAARRLHDIEVRTATLAEHASWSEQFDVILLVGVIEHLREVPSALRIVAALLRPGGVLYCAQPDVEAFADCRNAPYQQFSTEHINYFSQESLSRTMHAAGLEDRITWRWMIEWREGVQDSVVSGMFARPLSGSTDEKSPGEREQTSREGLRRYLAQCRQQEAEIVALFDGLATERQTLLVWGAGSLTRRLLLSTALSRCTIAAFIDSNPASRETPLFGRPVIAPDELKGRSEPILICSKAFEAEIRTMIRDQLRLSNRIITLPSA